MKKKLTLVSLAFATLLLGACSSMNFMNRQLVEEVPRKLDTPCVQTKDGSCAGWYK